jgi:hypothetical protein
MTMHAVQTGVIETTKFERWARKYGVNNLVDEMRRHGPDSAVTFSAIYQWLRADHEPRGHRVRALVEISAGDLSVQDIHDHFSLKQRARAAH